jgi:hypothetical protein
LGELGGAYGVVPVGAGVGVAAGVALLVVVELLVPLLLRRRLLALVVVVVDDLDDVVVVRFLLVLRLVPEEVLHHLVPRLWRGRLERKRRVVWTSNLREQVRGLGLGRRLWLRGGTVPLLDVAQIDAQRRGGAREAGRRQGGGGSGRRGRMRLVEKWRMRGLGLVESIYI